jgi:hypothetical protein
MSRRAEALLRALVGVHHAEVTFRAAGAIASVRVAAAGLSSGLLIRNIRSALLAGLGVAVDPLQIELVAPERWTPPGSEPVRELEEPGTSAPEDDGPDALAARAGEPQIREADAASRPGAAIAPRNGASAGGNGNGAAHVESGNGHVPGNAEAAPADAARNGDAESRRREPGVSRERARPRPPRADPLLGQAEAKRAAAHERARRGTFAAADGSARVDVERVDLVRHAGRLRCRVVIAAGATRFSAIADGPDEAGNEIQLAGRVACDALRAGALTSAQFESATIAYLAGRVHVVAALGDWQNGEPMPRSGSAVAGESLEHAAARAVLQAVLAQPA